MLCQRLLVVCAGNLCRSPLAEALVRARLAQTGPDLEVASAGLIAAVGEPADGLMCLVAQAHGLDLSLHQSRPLDPELLRWADLVLVMEEGQRRQLVQWAPGLAGKVRLLGHWTGGEIPDPFARGRDAAESAYGLIEAAVDAWLARL